MSTNKSFKPPILVRASGDWFVKYFHEIPDHPGKFKEFRVRDGINRIADEQERETYGNRLCLDIEKALENGYNPFKVEKAVKKVQLKKEETKAKNKSWTIELALIKFIENCKFRGLTENSMRTYRALKSAMFEYCEKNNILNKLVKDFTDADIEAYLNFTSASRKWSARSYNNNVNITRTFFNLATKLERKANGNKYDVDLSDITKKIDRTDKNKYYSKEVSGKVKLELEKDPVLNNFIQWIYYSCMRPKEILSLKISDIEIDNRHIRIKGIEGKTGFRLVPISTELEKLIIELSLNQYPSDFYIFGENQRPNKKPSYDLFFSRRYLKIKRKLGLSDEYTMYGWKHTRVVNLIYAGFSDYEIMSLTGHKSKDSFEKYKRELVLDPNNKMSGKTIEF